MSVEPALIRIVTVVTTVDPFFIFMI